MSATVLKLAEFVPKESLSSEAQSLIDYTINTPKRKRVSRDTIVEQFNDTFQLIGGVPRLAIWADQNPTQFYQLYSKLLPAAIKAELSMPQNVDDMTPEQIKEMTTDQLKRLLLIRAGEQSTDVEHTSVPPQVPTAD